jgi:hypothetical protein
MTNSWITPRVDRPTLLGTAIPKVNTLRRHLTELIVVFVGVALAFAVENLREDLNERAVGEQYLRAFRADLLADLAMLQAQQETRRGQLKDALVVLEFFEGQTVNPQRFFEAYYSALRTQYTSPNRNTMDEVLSSGSLRLIRDANIRSRLLDLYVTYDRIARTEEHISRDFDTYLYDTTFSSIRLQLEGPWEDTPANRSAVDTLLNNLTIENGVRLIVGNLELDGAGLLDELELARSQVEHLLQIIPVD